MDKGDLDELGNELKQTIEKKTKGKNYQLVLAIAEDAKRTHIVTKGSVSDSAPVGEVRGILASILDASKRLYGRFLSPPVLKRPEHESKQPDDQRQYA